jgi:hypothetical protein
MCSGLSIMEHLDPRKYRIIMRSLHMEYHYQARKAAVATCLPEQDVLAREVIIPLKENAAVEHESTVRVHDVDGNHLATGTIIWQVKKWASVRTKV